MEIQGSRERGMSKMNGIYKNMETYNITSCLKDICLKIKFYLEHLL